MRVHFPRRRYRRRNCVEGTFSAVKRKLSCRAAGKSPATQISLALLLGLAFNLYRLKPSPGKPGMSTVPDGF
jgi:hypothetical protein